MPASSTTTSPPLAFTVAEAARSAKFSTSYIYKLINEGLLPSIVVGRTRRILHDDLVRFLESHRVEQAVRP